MVKVLGTRWMRMAQERSVWRNSGDANVQLSFERYDDDDELTPQCVTPEFMFGNRDKVAICTDSSFF